MDDRNRAHADEEIAIKALLAGSELTAERLLQIARTGEHAGAFASEKVEACAQAILRLRTALERAKPFVVLAGARAQNAGLPFGGATETLALIDAALAQEQPS